MTQLSTSVRSTMVSTACDPEGTVRLGRMGGIHTRAEHHRHENGRSAVPRGKGIEALRKLRRTLAARGPTTRLPGAHRGAPRHPSEGRDFDSAAHGTDAQEARAPPGFDFLGPAIAKWSFCYGNFDSRSL